MIYSPNTVQCAIYDLSHSASKPEQESFISADMSSLTWPIKEFSVGKTAYVFLRPIQRQDIPSEDGWTSYIRELPNHIGKGPTAEEAFEDLQVNIHVDFQRLHRKRPFEMSEEERDVGKRLNPKRDSRKSANLGLLRDTAARLRCQGKGHVRSSRGNGRRRSQSERPRKCNLTWSDADACSMEVSQSPGAASARRFSARNASEGPTDVRGATRPCTRLRKPTTRDDPGAGGPRKSLKSRSKRSRERDLAGSTGSLRNRIGRSPKRTTI